MEPRINGCVLLDCIEERHHELLLRVYGFWLAMPLAGKGASTNETAMHAASHPSNYGCHHEIAVHA